MSKVVAFAEAIDKILPPCKGQFFRYRESYARTGRGGWKMTVEIYPLKRQSCVGCPECWGISSTFDDSEPEEVEVDPRLSSGDVCGIFFEIDSHDEYGTPDGWHPVLRKV